MGSGLVEPSQLTQATDSYGQTDSHAVAWGLWRVVTLSCGALQSHW